MSRKDKECLIILEAEESVRFYNDIGFKKKDNNKRVESSSDQDYFEAAVNRSIITNRDAVVNYIKGTDADSLRNCVEDNWKAFKSLYQMSIIDDCLVERALEEMVLGQNFSPDYFSEEKCEYDSAKHLASDLKKEIFDPVFTRFYKGPQISRA